MKSDLPALFRKIFVYFFSCLNDSAIYFTLFTLFQIKYPGIY